MLWIRSDSCSRHRDENNSEKAVGHLPSLQGQGKRIDTGDDITVLEIVCLETHNQTQELGMRLTCVGLRTPITRLDMGFVHHASGQRPENHAGYVPYYCRICTENVRVQYSHQHVRYWVMANTNLV